MARKSKKNNTYFRSARVVSNKHSNARRSLHQTYKPMTFQTSLFPDLLSEIEDFRRFTPIKFPKKLDGRYAAIMANQKNNTVNYGTPFAFTPSPLPMAFQQPDQVIRCVRRKSRREVLHARGIAGNRNLRPPRRNEFSDVKC